MAMLATSASAWASEISRIGKPDGFRHEQVEATQDQVLQPQWYCTHRGETSAERSPPRTVGHGEICVEAGVDTTARCDSSRGRSLVVLDLEQLEQPDLLGRSADHPELAVAVGQQDSGGGGLQQLDAARRQHA